MENNKGPEKEKPRRKKVIILKWIVHYVSIVAVVLFIVFVTLSIILTFPDYVPISNADNLLQIWITANGVLMGFHGLDLLTFQIIIKQRSHVTLNS